MRRVLQSLILSLTLAILPFWAHAHAPETPKRVVRTQDDLPRYTYTISGTASTLLTANDVTFNVFAAKVAADIGTTLRSYDIVDRASKRSLLMTLQSIAILQRDEPRVLALAEQIHDVEGKPADKLLSSMRLKALIAAHGQTGQVAGDRFRAAYASNYAASLTVLPWSVVGEAIKDGKSAAIRQTDQVILGSVATFIEPAVARNRALSGDLAAQLIYARVVTKVWLPVRTQTIAVLKAYIAAHRVEKPDIWAAREVALTSRQKLTPVNVAIWDEGSDL